MPNGIPGVETRLPILFSEGVVSGRITLEQFVALTSTNHAKMYGLYPKKGSIAIGADADLVIWDPKRKETIRQEILHHGSDYTPWEGEVTGWPVKTILRGKLVYDDGNIVGAPGDGHFLNRGYSPYAAPRAAAHRHDRSSGVREYPSGRGVSDAVHPLLTLRQLSKP